MPLVPAGKPVAPSEISTGLAPPPPPPPQKPPPKKPQGRAPAPSEVSTGISSPEPSFRGPPLRILQQYGFHGSIEDVNDRVQSITDAYQDRFGRLPSSGLVFDLLRSPVQDFGSLLDSVPKSGTEARLQGSLSQGRQQRPYEYFVRDQNGNLQWNTPIGEMIRQVTAKPYEAPQAPPQQQQQQNFNSLAKSHPWVPTESGFVPITDFFGFIKAVEESQKKGFPENLQVGGQKLADYQRQVDLANQAAQYAPLPKPGQGQAQAQQINKNIAQAKATLGAAQAVTTVKAGQQQLQQVAPDFFGDLPTDGNFNQTWATRLRQWQSTGNYFRQSTQKLASQNGFGNRADLFVKAWQGKQDAIRKNPFAAHVIQNIPLVYFGNWGGPAGSKLGLIQEGIMGGRHGWHLITPSGIFAGLVNTAKLGFDVAAGTFQQGEADAGFTTTYMRHVTESAWKPGQTEAMARKAAYQTLLDSPSVMRIAAAGYLPEHPKGNLALANTVSELVFDIAIMSPRVLGVRVAANDLNAIHANTYFQAKVPFSYQALKQGQLREAIKSLERGSGSEALAVKTMPLIQSGELPLNAYEHMVAGLYAHGRVPLPDGTFASGPVLGSLRSYGMPTPGPATQIAQEAWSKLKVGLDDFELGARKSGHVGTDNAANFLSHARVLFTRIAPQSETRYLFADRTPEDIYNFAVKNLVGTAEGFTRQTADQMHDEFVTARVNNNIKGMLAVEDKLRGLYYKTYPEGKRGVPSGATEGPQIIAEGPAYFRFPAKQYQKIDATSSAFDKLSYYAQRTNQKLNGLAALHRETIVSGVPFGGFSLAYKHAVSDTGRRLLGGGGPLFFETPKVKAAQRTLDGIFQENPSLQGFYSAEKASAAMGEYRYMVKLGTTSPEKFSTGEKLGKPGEKFYTEAAGADMRHLLSDNALSAYLQSSKDDLLPLKKFVMQDSFHRQAILGSEAYQKDLAVLKGAGGNKDAIDSLRQEHALNYAETLYGRYQGLDEALSSAGTDFNAASAVLRANLGPRVDAALGKFIRDNQIDYEVRQGLVSQPQFDQLMQRWIGVLMTANKWNRGKMFDHVFGNTFAELHGAGWQPEDAIQAAAQIAKRQTVYHMLDFSNMLQVEQNLRWMSYFATKHRLYWTWIAKTFWRRPALASAIQNQIAPHLKNGNLYFTIAGKQLFVPAGRLVWVNSTEYPETSPIVQAAYAGEGALLQGKEPVLPALASVKATSGNVFTRSDQAVLMWIRLAQMEAGNIPATYAGASVGLAGRQQQDFNRRVNEYVLSYYHQHGTYPAEHDAVKHVLLWAALNETQRSNMFVPVMTAGGKPPAIQNLFDQYGKILSPVKKRDFLDKHPELQDWFGISADPELKQHNDTLWAQYKVAQSEYDKSMSALLDQVIKAGVFTPQTANQVKALGDTRNKLVQNLIAQDKAWQGPNKAAGQPGPWTKQLEGDPLAARGILHHLFPNIPGSELNAHTVGQTIQDLQAERNLLVKQRYEKTYQGVDAQNRIKTRLSEIGRQLAVFYAYPSASTPALKQAENTYYHDHVGAYINQRNAKTATINSQMAAQSGGLVLNPRTGQYEYKPSLNRLETEFRAWRDAHDKPVTITINGRPITFPSPVQMGWQRLPPDLRKAALARLAGDNYEHIADYEKHLLGLKTIKGESDAWMAYTKLYDLYSREAALQGQSISKQQKSFIAQIVQQGLPSFQIKSHPQFMDAYRFSLRPKYQRVEQTNLIQDSQYKQQWKTILTTADYFWRGIQKGSPQRQTQSLFREYVNGGQFQGWLNQTPSGFRRELSLFGPNFLNTLTS